MDAPSTKAFGPIWVVVIIFCLVELVLDLQFLRSHRWWNSLWWPSDQSSRKTFAAASSLTDTILAAVVLKLLPLLCIIFAARDNILLARFPLRLVHQS